MIITVGTHRYAPNSIQRIRAELELIASECEREAPNLDFVELHVKALVQHIEDAKRDDAHEERPEDGRRTR
jgi:hypothetical protein